MTRKRPIAVMVFGILNLIFGVLLFGMSLCCGVAFIGFYAMIRTAYQQVPNADQKELDELWAVFSNNVPGLMPFMIGFMVVMVVLAVMQIVSGIGLVIIRGWGRWLCAIWGGLQVVATLGFLFYLLAILGPGMEKAANDMERWMEKQEEKQRKMGMQPQPRQKMNQISTGNPVRDNLGLIAVCIFYLGYGALAFVFMVLPQTGKAIARYRDLDDDMASERQGDFYDDEYERRRREPEQPPGSGPPI